MVDPPASHRTMRRRTVSSTSAQRFADRAHRRRRLAFRPVIWVLWALIGLTLIGGAAWILLESGRVAVQRLDVTGLDRLDRAEVLRTAGVTLGEPLVLLDADAVARRITAALPVAHSVAVSRRWPQTVRIEMHERVAVAGVRTSGGVQLFDRDGVAFAVDAQLPDGVIPVLFTGEGSTGQGSTGEGSTGEGLAPVDGTGALAVSGAAVVVAALPPQVREHVVQITARSPDAIDLELRDGRFVHWGGSERSARKAVVLRALLSHPAEVYDVSAPDAPTTRG